MKTLEEDTLVETILTIVDQQLHSNSVQEDLSDVTSKPFIVWLNQKSSDECVQIAEKAKQLKDFLRVERLHHAYSDKAGWQLVLETPKENLVSVNAFISLLRNMQMFAAEIGEKKQRSEARLLYLCRTGKPMYGALCSMDKY